MSTLSELDELDLAAAALVRNNLAHLLYETGDREEAAQMAHSALQLHRIQGDRRHQSAPFLAVRADGGGRPRPVARVGGQP